MKFLIIFYSEPLEAAKNLVFETLCLRLSLTIIVPFSHKDAQVFRLKAKVLNPEHGKIN